MLEVNMRKISKLLICLTILVFISFIFQINVNAQAAEINKGKIYSNATINDKFSPDSVLILLDEEASYSDKIYTVDDFDNVKCSDVTDLTEDKFTKIMSSGEKSKDSTYNRVLCLELSQRQGGRRNTKSALSYSPSISKRRGIQRYAL